MTTEKELRSAVCEYAESLTQDQPDAPVHEFSEGFTAKMDSILNNTEAAPIRRSMRMLKRVGMVAAALVIILGVTLVVSPAARAAAEDIIFGVTKYEVAENFVPEKIYVAQFPEECLEACDLMRYGESEEYLAARGLNTANAGASSHWNIPMVLRVTPVGEQKDILHADQQHFIVKEVFRGKGVSAGDEIMLNWSGHITNGYNELAEPVKPHVYLFYRSESTRVFVETKFSNVMQVGKDYLVFAEGKCPLSKGSVPQIDLYYNLVVPSIYCYEDLPGRAVATETAKEMKGSTYVDYEVVKDNEFFGTSQKVLDELTALKKDLLAAYPIGSGK